MPARPDPSPGQPATGAAGSQAALRRQRWLLLARIHRALDPMFLVLSVIWVVLVVIELGTGALPPSLELLVWVIWILFVAEFVVALLLAPSVSGYLSKRWLTALALLLPPLRLFRVATLARFVSASRLARSVGLLRVLTSINRGLGALGRTARRRGVGYVVAATAIVLALGAAGMAFFEDPATLAGHEVSARSGLAAYADALWWTAYAMTTGAPTIPASGEGRLLGWVLSLYGLGVFGYLTAILASHFVGRDTSQVVVASRPGRPPDRRNAA